VNVAECADIRHEILVVDQAIKHYESNQ
jgi:hypothetical protein